MAARQRLLLSALLLAAPHVTARRSSAADLVLEATMDCDMSRYSKIKERYTDMRYVGAGANGCVVLAKDTQNGGVEVAVKLSKRPGKLHSWQSECAQSRILHEKACEAGAEAFQLAERYLPVCLEVGGTDEAPFMVMHAAGGKGIGDARRRIPKDKRASVWAQMVGALTAMHGVGLSHNDLHNNNVVILDKDGSLVVFIDFGEVVPLARAQYSGGYKQDENLLAREASLLAGCATSAQYPFHSENIDVETRDARKQELFTCLKESWCQGDSTCDDEFFGAFGSVIDEAWEHQQQHPKGLTKTLVPELYHTAFVQEHQPPLQSLFPGVCKPTKASSSQGARDHEREVPTPKKKADSAVSRQRTPGHRVEVKTPKSKQPRGIVEQERPKRVVFPKEREDAAPKKQAKETKVPADDQPQNGGGEVHAHGQSQSKSNADSEEADAKSKAAEKADKQTSETTTISSSATTTTTTKSGATRLPAVALTHLLVPLTALWAAAAGSATA